jgi:phosphatidate cytidylyltransferase
MIDRDLLTRLVSALVLVAIALIGAWLGGIAAGLVAAAITAIIHLEWSGVTEGEMRPAAPLTALVAVACLAAGAGYLYVGLAISVFAALAGAATSAHTFWRPLGVVYVSMFGLSLLALRDSEYGFAAVAFVCFVVAGTDTAAYFGGRAIGGPKLAPRLSPKKTWAGAIAGFIGANAFALVPAIVAGVPIGLALVLVASLLSIAAQFGDLFESFVKRRFGAKDSGNIMPGHGGLMDRVDGIVFAGPVALLVGALNGGGDPAGGLLFW